MRIVVSKPHGGEYATEFFQCWRCTVMFREPDRFSRLGMPIRRWCGDVGPKTIAEAHYFWREDLEKKG